MENKYRSDPLRNASPDMPKPEWMLFRIDDNGNETEMERFRDRLSAERVMRAYEAKGHKQAYFVRKAKT